MRYYLLVITWFLVLAANIYLLIKYGTFNIWLWIILAALSIIPLTDKLKIGSWFDYRKRVTNAEQEEATNQGSITNIGNLNINLQNEEAAQVFAKRLIPYSEPKRLTETETLTDEDKEVITFIYNVDRATASLLPLLRVLYMSIISELAAWETGGREWKEKSKDMLEKDILFLMHEVKKNAPKTSIFKDHGSKFVELFEPVEKLIKVRNTIDEIDVKPPVEEMKALVGEVYKASGYITGMFATGMSFLLSRGNKTRRQ